MPVVDHATPLAPPADARRLHPLSPLLTLAPALRQLAVPAVLLLLASWQVAGPLIALGVVVVLLFTALRARATRYSLDHEQLLVWSGVFNKSVRVVSPSRVQQVELVQHLRHRVTDLAAIRIELVDTGTASTRVELDALHRAEAERLHDVLERGRRRAAVATGNDSATPSDTDSSDVPAPPASTLLRLSTRELVIAGLTGAPALLVPPLLVSAWVELLDLVERVSGIDLQPSGVPFVLLAAGLIVLWPLVAGGLMVFRCHGYEVGRSGDDLIARRGLLDTRVTVLPLPRVQLVDRSATVPRRWLRRAALEVRTASGGTATHYPVGMTIPGAPAATLDALIGLVMGRPELILQVATHPPTARRRAIHRRFIAAATPVVAGTGVVSARHEASVPVMLGTAAVVAIGVLLLATVWGRSWYRRLGHAVRDGMVVVRSGVLVEHLRVAPVNRIQSVTIAQSPWQRRAGLCTARLLLAGATDSVRIPDLAPTDAVALAALVRGLDAIDTGTWVASLSPAPR